MTIPILERKRYMVGKYEIIAKPFPYSAHMFRYTVFVDGRRIEQADIGPRSGRGSTWGSDRHQYIRFVQTRKAK